MFKRRNIHKEISNMISGTVVVYTEDDIWDVTRMRRDVKPVQLNQFYRMLRAISNDRRLIRELITDVLTHDERITDDSITTLIYDMIDIIEYLSSHNGKAYLVKVLVHPQMVVRLIPVSTMDESEIRTSFQLSFHRERFQ